MDAYIYDAAMLCEECAEEIKEELDAEKVKDTGDSGDYPQGPYSDGGGESDSPQHCDECHVFLENPLTSDGYEYVNQAVIDHLCSSNKGDKEVLKEWVYFYQVKLKDLADNGLTVEELLG